MGVAAAHAGQTTKDYTKEMQTPAAEERIGMGWYVAPFGGGNVDQDANFDHSRVHTFGNSYRADASLGRSVGWFAGLKGGYVFDTHSWILPALELEAFYDNVDVKVNGDVGDVTGHLKANMQSGNFMLNVQTKFDLGHFRPYIGGGVGAAYIYGSDFSGSVDVPGHGRLGFSNAEDFRRFGNFRRDTWDFAWEAIGGADYYLTPRLSLFAEYKALFYYVNHDGVSNYLQHLVGGGVRIHF